MNKIITIQTIICLTLITLCGYSFYEDFSIVNQKTEISEGSRIIDYIIYTEETCDLKNSSSGIAFINNKNPGNLSIIIPCAQLHQDLSTTTSW